ncbi:hypothetical protein FRC02_004169 [Tulasnella sp. 418]|nr:hypothetical protein FRC02_004169 [Tulasnella sp. 418]
MPDPFLVIGVVVVAAMVLIITLTAILYSCCLRDKNYVPLDDAAADDVIIIVNEDPAILRERARNAGQFKEQLREQADALPRRKSSLARKLRKNAEMYEQEQVRLNKIASDLIYQSANHGNGPEVIDLHYLYVREAIERTEIAIRRARKLRIRELRIIVGRGNNSRDFQAKLRPAVLKWLRRNGYPSALHRNNNGMVIVDLRGAWLRYVYMLLMCG